MLFITTTSITCIDFKSIKDRIEVVNVTAKENIPIIRVSVAGEEYLFLVDSQSPVSFIDSTVVVKKRLTMTNVKAQDLMLVTGDSSKRNKIVSIMDNSFYVHNFKRTKSSIEWHTGLSIDGIIGNDMLYNNRATVDIRRLILDKIKEKK